MTTQNHTYAVNKTKTNISLRTGYTMIPSFGFLKIPKSDMDHTDFQHAFNNDWIEYSDVEPVAKELTKPNYISSHQPNAGLSEAEFKELLAKNAEKAKGTGVTVTKLGGEDSAVKAEAEPVAPATTETTAEAKEEVKSARKAK